MDAVDVPADILNFHFTSKERSKHLLEPLGIVRSDESATGGADLIPVAPAGVPLVDLDQDRSLYFDIHHTENDTLDKIDPANLRQLAAALVTVVDWAAGRAERLATAPVDPAP